MVRLVASVLHAVFVSLAGLPDPVRESVGLLPSSAEVHVPRTHLPLPVLAGFPKGTGLPELATGGLHPRDVPVGGQLLRNGGGKVHARVQLDGRGGCLEGHACFKLLEDLLDFLDDAVLGLVVGDDEVYFCLDAHLGAGTDVELQLLVVADAQGSQGQFHLDPHLAQVTDQHRQLIGQFLVEQVLGHAPDLLALPVLLGLQVGGDAVGNELVEVDQGLGLLHHTGHGDHRGICHQLGLLEHLHLLLPLLSLVGELLLLLD